MHRKGSKKREGKLILTGEADNRTKNSRGLHLTRVCVVVCKSVCVCVSERQRERERERERHRAWTVSEKENNFCLLCPVFGGGDFGRCLGHEGGALMNGISALIKETPGNSLISSAM